MMVIYTRMISRRFFLEQFLMVTAAVDDEEIKQFVFSIRM